MKKSNGNHGASHKLQIKDNNQKSKEKAISDKTFRPTLFKNLFVPAFCLQGAEFQIHCEWDIEKQIKIEILIPDSIEILNVDNTELYQIIEKRILHIDSFTVNGFLGVVLKAKMLPNSSVDETIHIKVIKSELESEIICKTIHLFRPEIKIINNTSTISITKNGDNFKIINPLQIKNVGEGTAIVGFKVADESELKIEQPSGTGEFLKNYIKDLHKGLRKLQSDFPQNAELLDGFILLGTIPFEEFDKNVLKRVEELLEKLNEACDSDADFLDGMTNCIIEAYINNINEVVNLEGFLNYIKSAESKRVLLKESINVLKVTQMPKKFKAVLNYGDLTFDFFSPIPVKFDVVSNCDCEIPIYKIIEIL